MSSGFDNWIPPENRMTTQENGHHSHNYRRSRLPPLYPPSDSTRNLQNPRRRTHDVWLPTYQERVVIRHPFPFTRVPTAALHSHHNHAHLFVIGQNDHPHDILGVPQRHHHHLNLDGQQQVLPTDHHYIREESKLSKEEQKSALSKLRKETYNPSVVKRTYKPNYYVRDWDIIFSRQQRLDKEHEHGKTCAVCLEDFEAKEDVTLTPCNHMFHEDCILPWVKTHGLCPVCRFTLFDTIIREPPQAEAAAASNNANSRNHDDDENHLFGRDLISVIRTIHEIERGFRSNRDRI